MIIDRFLPNPMGGFFIQRSCSCGGIGIHNRLKICRPYGLASSSLAGSMVMKNRRACSSAGRAPDLHSGGHRFDPVQVHLTNIP